MSSKLTKEEIREAVAKEEAEVFLEWKRHPVTQALFQHLREHREDLKERWASGDTVMPDAFQYALQNTLVHAECEVIKLILEIEAIDLGVNSHD
jgi:hypothetical protein